MLIIQQHQKKSLLLSISLISVIVFSVFLVSGKVNFGIVVAQQQDRIDWGQICRTPFIDSLITEPCESLITPDGYNLTPEGQRILGCVIAEGAGSVLFPELSSLLKSMGTAVGCDSEASGLVTSGPASSFPSQGPPTIQPACESTVTGNVTLPYNLNCQGHGLTK